MLTELLPVNSRSQAKIQYAKIGDFQLVSGEIVENCRIGYRILGKMNENKSNIILFPTWFGGSSADVASLIDARSGGFLDTSKYCVIIVDALGNGYSSSPSNSITQPDSLFPFFSVKDLVNTQHLLLTKILDVNHVYAIVGGSMGGMQVFQWLVSYPDFMTKAVPYLATPYRTSYDLLLNRLQAEIIETGIKNKISPKDIQFQLNMLLNIVARTPEWISKNKKRSELDSFINSLNTEPSKIYSLWNYLSQLKAMYKHDITSDFEFNPEKTAAAINAKILIIVSESDHIVQPYHTLEFAKLINAETYIIKSDCGHLAVNCDLENTKKVISNFLDNE